MRGHVSGDGAMHGGLGRGRIVRDGRSAAAPSRCSRTRSHYTHRRPGKEAVHFGGVYHGDKGDLSRY